MVVSTGVWCSGTGAIEPKLRFVVQDEWRVRPDFTINAAEMTRSFGRIRFKLMRTIFRRDSGSSTHPATENSDTRKLWPLLRSHSLRATSNALQRIPKFIVAQLSPTQPGAPFFQTRCRSNRPRSATRPNITRIDPNIEASYSQHANRKSNANCRPTRSSRLVTCVCARVT